MEYYVTLEKLIVELNSIKEITPDKLRKALAEICRFMRVSKIMVSFFEDIKHEQLDKGEIYCCYDNGENCNEKIVMSKRIVTDMLTVLNCTIYMPEDEKPWSEQERQRVEMIMQTVIVYVNRCNLKSQVEKLTFYDDDGYHNLRFFFRYISRIAEDNLIGGKVVMQFNLRHFSLVNQQIGRNAGSFVMHRFFLQLKKDLEGKGIVCRMGGDNFVLLCEKDQLEKTLDYLRGTAVIYDINSGERIMVSAYVGVYIIPDDFEFDVLGDIMDKLIAALSAAKSNGKDTIVFYNDEMIATKEKIMHIQQLFPVAIKNEEFKVFYQPKIDVNNGELIGAEALCRWFHDGKIVSPMNFIPILEQSTDICKLDFYMLDHVCKDVRRWLDSGKKVVRVSVNLSRKHMMDYDLLNRIIEIVNSNNVPHEYIEIELTETTTDVEFKDLKRVVRGLQEAGISTSVDDFGMGYSSLNLIKEVPWNVLKVDRSFLPEEDDDSDSTRSIMFKYVVAMAKELGLECIAEGVETQSQVEILRNNQCELAQGFFFDKPLPIDDFEQRLTRHKYNLN